MEYVHLNTTQARHLIRSGSWKGPTTGLAPGYVQANLVVLPGAFAEEFATFCRLNPGPAPLLERTAPGNPHPMKLAPEADLRTDLPCYRVYREGKLVEVSEDLLSLWQEDFVAFLLGRSFSAEQALIAPGIRLRHLKQGRNVAPVPTVLSSQYEAMRWQVSRVQHW